MKRLVKLVLLIAVVVIALPLLKYRTLKPCGMLQKDRIERIQEGIDAAGDEVRDVASEHSDRVEEIVGNVSDALEGFAEGLAERAAELEVSEMSARECAVELWKSRKKD